MAHEALFRVQTPAPDETLVERTWQALWQIDRVHKAPTAPSPTSVVNHVGPHH